MTNAEREYISSEVERHAKSFMEWYDKAHSQSDSAESDRMLVQALMHSYAVSTLRGLLDGLDSLKGV